MSSEKKNEPRVQSSPATKIDFKKLKELLTKEGYKKYYPVVDGKNLQPKIVKVEDYIVESVQLDSILKHFKIKNIINGEDDDKLISQFEYELHSNPEELRGVILSRLTVFEGEFKDENELCSYFYFLNKAYVVDSENIYPTYYWELEKYIWRNKILNIDFDLLTVDRLDEELFEAISLTTKFIELNEDLKLLGSNKSLLNTGKKEIQKLCTIFIYAKQQKIKRSLLETKELLLKEGIDELLFKTEPVFVDFMEHRFCEDEELDLQYLLFKYDEEIFPEDGVNDFNKALEEYAKFKNCQLVKSGKTNEYFKFVRTKAIEKDIF